MSQFPPPPGAPEDPYSQQNQPGQPEQNPYGQQPGQPGQPGQGQPGQPPYGPPQGQPGQPPYGPPQGQPGQPPYGPPQGQPGQPPYGQPQGQPYGQPGGFPSAPQYQGQPSMSPQATDALGSGWSLFTKNWGPLVGAIVVWGIILSAISLIVLLPMGIFSSQSSTSGLGGSAAVSLGIGGTIVLALVMVLVSVLAGGAFLHGALRAVDTGRASFADFFKFRNSPHVLLLAVILAVVNGLLSFTVIIPLVVGFFTFFSLFFVIDRGMSAIDAIKASVNLATSHVGQTILMMVLSYIVTMVGAILCGVGMLVAGPVALLATAAFYRALTGPAHQQPAPPSFG